MRRSVCLLCALWMFAGAGEARAQDEMSSMSIVGFDPETGEVGIALASKFFAVGPIAAHVRADVGAVALMGGAPFKEGKEILDWIEQGSSPEEALQKLREKYPQGIGQINIVDVKGRSYSTTSATQANMWKGSKYGKHYAAAGNILAGPQVVDSFAKSFESTDGIGLPLAERLLEALEAADKAGGDARGRQGATLIVSRKGGNPRGTDNVVDLRVDDSNNAVIELRKLYMRWKGEAQIPGFRELGISGGNDVRWLQRSLQALNYLPAGDLSGQFDAATADAVTRYKRDRRLGASPSAGLETVNAIRRDLETRGLRVNPGNEALEEDVEEMSSLSIAGYDPDTGDVGNCMTSKYFAVGPVASFARAGVGAITIMQSGPFTMGEQMLDWMEKEKLSAVQVLERVRSMLPDTGQINIVDVQGRSISTTGPNGSQWQGQRFGKNYATSGNILAGPAVVNAFADTFESTEGSGLPLAERLLRACEAAYRVGGDARGAQGAQLKVYRKGAGFRGTDLLIDLRVDDSVQAISELRRLWEEWQYHHKYGVGYQPIEQTSGNDVRQMQRYLRTLGYLRANDRAVFDERGEPRGVFNDATANAVVQWKKAAGFDEGAYLVPHMLRELKKQAEQKGGIR
ncbi:MAG: DUF1028 domain-containing protein [Acidobacteria bacterium]|nr:DUF1028 domain-containing protein [Acidobacteriota bacterium]